MRKAAQREPDPPLTVQTRPVMIRLEPELERKLRALWPGLRLATAARLAILGAVREAGDKRREQP